MTMPDQWIRQPLEDDTELTAEARQCLTFLCDNLAFTDWVNHSYEFYKELVLATLETQKQVPWALDPEDPLFRLYVLDPRSGSEHIDRARSELAPILLPLVQGLSMEDAVGAINMWCFGQAVYGSTDRRTVAPLTMMKRGFGRCGEESSFVVAALRAVGIPSRQVYAPRWVHNDDNHAWVEVWTGDGWHYIGACEPEPVLDKGWFSVPATRAALLVARSIPGDEVPGETILEASGHRKLVNVTHRYAPVAKLRITVEGVGAGVEVTLRVLNYGELAPLVTLLTDTQGEVEIDLGLSDYFVTVSHQGRYTEMPFALPQEGKHLVLHLDASPETWGHSTYQGLWTVPQPRDVNWSSLSDERALKHEADVKRFEQARVDRLKAYENPDEASIEGAKDMGDIKEEEGAERTVGQMIAAAFGNREEILGFLSDRSDERRVELLRSLLYKDYSDVTEEVLEHHLAHAPEQPEGLDDEIYRKYLLSPRLSWEQLQPWRTIADALDPAVKADLLEDPTQITAWVESQIAPTDAFDDPMQLGDPVTSLTLRKANRVTRRNLCVAIARSLGIPARLHPVEAYPEYYVDGHWGAKLELRPPSTLTLEPSGWTTSSAYGAAWTISLWEEGAWKLLNLWGEQLDAEGTPTQIDLCRDEAYRLVVTARGGTGDVAWEMHTFSLENEEGLRIPIEDPSQRLPEQARDTFPKLPLRQDQGVIPEEGTRVYLFLEPGPEPTEHLLNELMARRYALEALQEDWCIVLPDGVDEFQTTYQRLRLTFPRMPVARITQEALDDTMASFFKQRDLPYVFVVNAEDEVCLKLHGYAIGSADQTLSAYEKERSS